MIKGSDQEFLRELCCLQRQWETTQPSWLSSPELGSPGLSAPIASIDTVQPEHIHQGPGKELREKPHSLVFAKSTLQGCLGTWATTILWPDFLAWLHMRLIPADSSVSHGLGWPWSLSPELWCPCSGSVGLHGSSARSLPQPLNSWHPRWAAGSPACSLTVPYCNFVWKSKQDSHTGLLN